MKALHLKNILSLLKNAAQTIKLYCLSDTEIVIQPCMDNYSTPACSELLYHFELQSSNTLRTKRVYIIDLGDITKALKHVKTTSVLTFSEYDGFLFCNVKLLTSSAKDIAINVSIRFPLIYDSTVVSDKIQYKSYDSIINSEDYNIPMVLSEFTRILKSLKNTAETYSVTFTDSECQISNIEAVIPISYNIPYPTSVEYDEDRVIVISNNCLLRLNKLHSNNNDVLLGQDYIAVCVPNEIKFYIAFMNVG